MKIDKLDKKILMLLQENGRSSNQDIAEKVGLSPAASLRRIRALEDQQIIRAYHADINFPLLGYDLIVHVDIALDSESALAMQTFERAVTQVDEILECHLMSGETDYKIILLARDLHDYEHIHRQILAKLPHVDKIKSSFSIRTVVRRFTMQLS